MLDGNNNYYWFLFGCILPCPKRNPEIDDYIRVLALGAAHQQQLAERFPQRMPGFLQDFLDTTSMILTDPKQVAIFTHFFDLYVDELRQARHQYGAVAFNGVLAMPKNDLTYSSFYAQRYILDILGVYDKHGLFRRVRATDYSNTERVDEQLKELLHATQQEHGEDALQLYQLNFWEHLHQVHSFVTQAKRRLRRHDFQSLFSFLQMVAGIFLLSLLLHHCRDSQHVTYQDGNGDTAQLKIQTVKIRPLNAPDQTADSDPDSNPPTAQGDSP